MAKKPTEPAREYTEFPDLVEVEFDKLVQEYNSITLTEEQCKIRKDELKTDIESWIMLAEQRKIKVGNLIAIRCNGSAASRLDKHLLVQNGCPVEVIEKSTVPGSKYTYIQVIHAGDEDQLKGAGLE